MSYINLKIKFWHYFFIILLIFSCTSYDEIKVYSSKNISEGILPIFYENGSYFHLNVRDSTLVKVVNESEIMSYNSNKLFRVILPKKESFLSIEGSNYQGGRFDLDYNFNYDFLIKNDSLYLNIIYPDKFKNSYGIYLSRSELDLIKSTINNFDIISSEKNIDKKFTITINFTNKTGSNFFIKDIESQEVSLFYDSIMFIIIKHLIRGGKYESLRNPIKTSTSKVYEGIRNPPNLNSHSI